MEGINSIPHHEVPCSIELRDADCGTAGTPSNTREVNGLHDSASTEHLFIQEISAPASNPDVRLPIQLLRLDKKLHGSTGGWSWTTASLGFRASYGIASVSCFAVLEVFRCTVPALARFVVDQRTGRIKGCSQCDVAPISYTKPAAA